MVPVRRFQDGGGHAQPGGDPARRWPPGSALCPLVKPAHGFPAVITQPSPSDFSGNADRRGYHDVRSTPICRMSWPNGSTCADRTIRGLRGASLTMARQDRVGVLGTCGIDLVDPGGLK